MTTAMNGNFTATVSTLDTVVEIRCHQQERLFLTFTVGSAALTDFNFEASAGGDWALIGSVAADYTSPEGPILGASGDLTIAAADGTVHSLRLDVQGFVAVRIQAAGTASVVTGHFSGQ